MISSINLSRPFRYVQTAMVLAVGREVLEQQRRQALEQAVQERWLVERQLRALGLHPQMEPGPQLRRLVRQLAR